MKFGGTSVGSADRMRAAARLSAEQRHKRPVVIVVSAMSGITDLLIETTKHAEAGDRAGLDANMRKLEERHTEACAGPASRRQAETGAGRHSRAGEGIRAHHAWHADARRPPAAIRRRSYRHWRTALRAHDGGVFECQRNQSRSRERRRADCHRRRLWQRLAADESDHRKNAQAPWTAVAAAAFCRW